MTRPLKWLHYATMSPPPDIDTLREGARQLVRELKVVSGCGLLPEVSLSECHVLLELDRRGRLTASDLSDILVLEKSTVSRVVQRLIKRGWIQRSTCTQDRRRLPLELSQDGRRQVQDLDGRADAEVGLALEFLPAEAPAQIAASLKQYARALSYARLSEPFTIRPIQPEDDGAVAHIITAVMTEFGAVGEGYSINDPEVRAMSTAYAGQRSAFYVVTRDNGQVLGCGGVAPLDGGDAGTCELRKMYFLPDLRGTGMGTRLLRRCLDTARELGFQRCYLETLGWMNHARHLYRKFGFTDLDAPLGSTGHSGCNRWMIRELA